MPEFLEKKLKKEYGANSSVPYAIMNKMGVMHGNKVTPKGAQMEENHMQNKAIHMEAKRRLAKKK